MSDIIRIGNMSGFYGDRFAAMREMLEGGELDYLNGDYLAELTMLILWKARNKRRLPSTQRIFSTEFQYSSGLAYQAK